ncbi:MAG TPA: hypothetical protein VNU75_12915 [Acidimicrobiales bacterium]|nr:hypothetical protein [Acidimicrobiales bacterium]
MLTRVTKSLQTQPGGNGTVDVVVVVGGGAGWGAGVNVFALVLTVGNVVVVVDAGGWFVDVAASVFTCRTAL